MTSHMPICVDHIINYANTSYSHKLKRDAAEAEKVEIARLEMQRKLRAFIEEGGLQTSNEQPYKPRWESSQYPIESDDTITHSENDNSISTNTELESGACNATMVSSVQRYKAIAEYTPSRPGELKLSPNFLIEASADNKDPGWWKGTIIATGESGYFPSNYVVPVDT